MTQVYIAILRGINVSGQKKINMSDLRKLLKKDGLLALETYIQSGNLVFKSRKSSDALVEMIQNRIKQHYGFEVPSQVLSAVKFESIINNNPFTDKDLTKLHVTFLAAQPELSDNLPPSPNPNESFLITDRVVYVYCPQGYGRTKINNLYFEKKLKTTATTRNWKTCVTLLEMANRIA